MDTGHYLFSAVRGTQAGREYFVAMCPLHLVPKLFTFDGDELTPDLRAQRILNKARLPEMARYVIENPETYVFSALTASVDADLAFEAVAGNRTVGQLKVPMSGRFVINDGQHRRAAIEMALKARPNLSHETIAVVFFSDIGLARSQQMFADLNRYATRPSSSLATLYDHRDSAAELTRRLVADCPVFAGLVEMERSTLSQRSRQLFTFSAVHQATKALLVRSSHDDFEQDLQTACDYWETLADLLPEWGRVRTGALTAADLRQTWIHSNGVVLVAFGRFGDAIMAERPETWRQDMAPLRRLDWSRTNPEWDGRAVVLGKLSKTTQSLALMANHMKIAVNLPLSTDEQRLEDEFQRVAHDLPV